MFTTARDVFVDDSSELETRSSDEQQEDSEDDPQQQAVVRGEGERGPEKESPVRDLQPGQMVRRTWRENKMLEAWNLASQERQRKAESAAQWRSASAPHSSQDFTIFSSVMIDDGRRMIDVCLVVI